MNIVAYFRVSTRRQGESGLGLEGQQSAVNAYAAQQHGATIVASFTEVESGKRHQNRPQLAKALRTAKALGATLVVAKLDRLARNVAFLSALMESGTPFVACDQPHATPLTLHILAAVAEDELTRISARLKAAFSAGKARGRKYGGANRNCYRFKAKDSKKGSDAAKPGNMKRAAEFRETVKPVALEMRSRGLTLEAIALEMNAAGYTTRRGKQWTVIGISRLLSTQTQGE